MLKVVLVGGALAGCKVQLPADSPRVVRIRIPDGLQEIDLQHHSVKSARVAGKVQRYAEYRLHLCTVDVAGDKMELVLGVEADRTISGVDVLMEVLAGYCALLAPGLQAPPAVGPLGRAADTEVN